MLELESLGRLELVGRFSNSENVRHIQNMARPPSACPPRPGGGGMSERKWCGADTIMASVSTSITLRKIQKQRRSTTRAMNAHSASCASSSAKSPRLSVIVRSSRSICRSDTRTAQHARGIRSVASAGGAYLLHGASASFEMHTEYRTRVRVLSYCYKTRAFVTS